MLHLQEA